MRLTDAENKQLEPLITVLCLMLYYKITFCLELVCASTLLEFKDKTLTFSNYTMFTNCNIQ